MSVTSSSHLPTWSSQSPCKSKFDGTPPSAIRPLTFLSIILVGLVVSYLPQHYRIIARGTSEGISPYFVLLGTTSATSGFANILTVRGSREAIGCCKELGTFECTAGLLGVAQLGLQWLCFTLMFVYLCLLRLQLYLPVIASSCTSSSSATGRQTSLNRNSAASPLGGRLPSSSAFYAFFMA